MTLSGKLIYLAVVLVVFALAMTFRMAIEGAMLKIFMALSGGLADLEGPLSTKNYIIGFFEKWGGAPGRRSTISGTTRSLLGETRQRAF